MEVEIILDPHRLVRGVSTNNIFFDIISATWSIVQGVFMQFTLKRIQFHIFLIFNHPIWCWSILMESIFNLYGLQMNLTGKDLASNPSCVYMLGGLDYTLLVHFKKWELTSVQPHICYWSTTTLFPNYYSPFEILNSTCLKENQCWEMC